MQLLTTLVFLAVTVTAMPTEPQSNEMNFVVRRETWKRASCAVELPKPKCANACCELAGGCSSLNCADSYVPLCFTSVADGTRRDTDHRCSAGCLPSTSPSAFASVITDDSV
ncbi:hypothetical protein B0I37DRAFT_358877 [Chaetomium sp. MPI-CAGE-AT-0009]|nr:hypothetical protein B0I37DRAFT_358877 [Chaetomium sp. MPI-CAGE-AT-0009]